MKSNANTHTLSDPNLSARHIAGLILAELITTQTPLDVCLSRSNVYHALSNQDKAFSLRLMQYYLRHYGQISGDIAPMLHKPLPAALTYINAQMGMAMIQMQTMDIPPYAAVNSAVELTKRYSAPHAGMVNAVLNKWIKQQNAVFQTPFLHNLPVWLRDRWEAFYGKEAVEKTARILTHEPPLDITFSSMQARHAWLAAYTEQGALQIGESIRLQYPGRVSDLPHYHEGSWWVQDVAASLPVCLFGDVSGKVILDMCAAPGGKTMQLASRGAKVIALDSSKKRLEVVRENLQRTHMQQVELHCMDALKFKPDIAPDGILLDAPCSATGTMRRNPDVLLHRNEKNILEQTEKQWKLLNHAADILPHGGILVYAVCSLEPEEGEQQIERLLKTRSDIIVDVDNTLLPIPVLSCASGLRTLPHMQHEHGGMDGFFMTRLKKQ